MSKTEPDIRSSGQISLADDMSIPTCVDTADEAIRLVRENHARWRNENQANTPTVSSK